MSTTFKHYLESKGKAKQGISTHFRQLTYFLNWCEDEGIESEFATYLELLGYMKHLQKKGVKQRTVQLYLNTLHHYFSWCVKRGVIAENPARNIDVKGIKRKYLYDILNKRELESLYENFELPTAKAPQQSKFQSSLQVAKRNKVMLGFMIWQGLGTAELSRLRVKDVKLREGKVYVSGSRRSNERELKLESHQMLDLMEYSLQVRAELLAHRKKESELLFLSIGEGNNFSNMLARLMAKLREQNPRVQHSKQLRASVITGWLKNYNLRLVQYMAGHRYVSSTESYLINDLEDLQEDISKFHPF